MLGVSFLSLDCPQLEKIYCTGMYEWPYGSGMFFRDDWSREFTDEKGLDDYVKDLWYRLREILADGLQQFGQPPRHGMSSRWGPTPSRFRRAFATPRGAPLAPVPVAGNEGTQHDCALQDRVNLSGHPTCEVFFGHDEGPGQGCECEHGGAIGYEAGNH